MLPLRSLGFLGLSPIIHCSACRFAPLFSQQDLRPQCFPGYSSSAQAAGEARFPHHTASSSASRLYSTTTASHGFSYRIGASFSAKGRRFNPKTDHYFYDPINKTREIYDTGKPTSGQDAFFVSRLGNGGSMAFGVADGVGGWSDSGIDSAHFSHGLCQRMIEVAESANTSTESPLGAQKLLQNGYDAVVADVVRHVLLLAGTTAILRLQSMSLLNHHTLEPAVSDESSSLGDSGFIQLRSNAVHHYSDPQTHAFNTPYQLSIIPPKVLARAKIFGGSPLSDYPRDASVTRHQLRHGDVLVFATDGVWDNLSSSDVLQIVSRHMTGFQVWTVGPKGTEVSDSIRNLTLRGGIPKEHEDHLQTLLAIAIAGEAKMASMNTRRDGPFAKEVKKFYPDEDFHGGKVDDICVVVAIVVKD